MPKTCAYVIIVLLHPICKLEHDLWIMAIKPSQNMKNVQTLHFYLQMPPSMPSGRLNMFLFMYFYVRAFKGWNGV